MLNKQLVEALLNHLQLNTLANLAIDLEEAQEDWRHYPEAAPPDPVKQALMAILALIIETGSARAEADQLDFQQILDQAGEARPDEDWLAERNRQSRENWYKDYQ